MKDVLAFNKRITLEEIVAEAKDVENLDGISFTNEHTGSQHVAKVNFSPATKKKACWKILLNGMCDTPNCPFSHEKRVIMQASLDMARGKITPPRNFGKNRGGRGGGGRGGGRGGGGGRGNGRDRRDRTDRNGRSGPTDKCKKEGPCPLRGHALVSAD